MTEENIVSFIVFGFSLSLILYFWGQLVRVLTDIIETVTKR